MFSVARAIALTASLLLVACGRAPESDVPPAFPGTPTLFAVSDQFDLGQILGAVPSPQFQVLEYEQEIETASRPIPEAQFNQRVTLVEQRSGLSVVDVHYQFADNTLDTHARVLGSADLLSLMQLVRQPRRGRGDEVIRSYVDLIDESTGRLFPMAEGNRLSYTLLRRVQQETGPRNRSPEKTLAFAYEFEVQRKLPPGVYASVEIDGPVWVIFETETSPDGMRAEREIHFAEQLGMPVYDEQQRGNVTTRRYLVAWEDDNGRRKRE